MPINHEIKIVGKIIKQNLKKGEPFFKKIFLIMRYIFAGIRRSFYCFKLFYIGFNIYSQKL